MSAATPVKTVGVIGGGQLGRMLALAGLPLGLRFVCLEPNADAPMAPLGAHLQAAYDDPAALDALAERCDVVTYEFENVPVAAAERLAARVPVWPPPASLAAAQDRLVEKRFFAARGIATAPFAPVGSLAELAAAVAQVGLPAVLKTRRMGYDGKGQVVLRPGADLDAAWAAVGGVPCILEGFVTFARELSIVAFRREDGAFTAHPLVENDHEGGVLVRTTAPAPNAAGLQAQAEAAAEAVMAELGHVGALAIEFFEVGGALVANEMAPRVHNSGHWSQDGAGCCQFENHLRAICGLPLGDARAHTPTVMHNLLGDVGDLAAVLATPNAHLHLYDKAPRPGRKLGHVNYVG